MVKVFKHLVEDDEYYFDRDKAEEVIRFIEKFCKLSNPRGKPFILLPWQRQIVYDVFGWYSKATGERRFVHVYIEIPRKNGKTYFLAALLIWLLMGEQPNAEIYAAACTRDQAGLLYKAVMQMVNQSAFLRERLNPTLSRKELNYANKDGFLKALSGENVGSHGKYPSVVACDELHEWQGEKALSLYEALISGFGNRPNPLVIHITTAGFGGELTLAKKLHEKALEFAEGECDDPTFYGVIYGAEATDNWEDEKVWERTNPSYELAKKNLRREYLAAKADIGRQNTFKRLFLNIWTEQLTRFLDLSDWDKCVNKSLSYADFKGKDVVIGLDLSETYDLTALALIAEEDGIWKKIVRCYMPEKQIPRRTKSDSVSYDIWAKEKNGWIRPTLGLSKGESVDYPTIVKDILGIADDCNIITVAYDPNNAIQIIPSLEAAGIHTTEIYPKFSDMSPGTKELHRRLTSREIELEANPCMRWQAANLEVISDNDGRIRPTKPHANPKKNNGGRSKYKVDGMTASVIASQAMLLTRGRVEAKKAEKKKKSAVYFI